jgi:hypothetical protein
MWKRWLFGVSVTLALAAFYFVVYPYGIAFGLWQPIVRPFGVSPSARYVSVIEDGSWFDCSIDEKRNVNVCRVWDSEGQLRTSGDFQYEDQHRAARRDELYPSMDGGQDTIYMFDGPGRRGTSKHALHRVGTPVTGIVY